MTDHHIPIAEANVDPDNPDWSDFESPEQVMRCIERAMAHLPRYNTQTRPLLRLGAHVSRVHDELEYEGEDTSVKFYGLNHDNVESIFGDIPRPLKTDEEEEREMQMLEGMWPELGVDAPTEEEWDAVMRADDKVLIWEIDNTWPNDETRKAVTGYQFSKHEDEWDYDSREEVVQELDEKYDLVRGPEESLKMFQDRYQVLQEDMNTVPKPHNYDWDLELAQE